MVLVVLLLEEKKSQKRKTKWRSNFYKRWFVNGGNMSEKFLHLGISSFDVSDADVISTFAVLTNSNNSN